MAGEGTDEQTAAFLGLKPQEWMSLLGGSLAPLRVMPKGPRGSGFYPFLPLAGLSDIMGQRKQKEDLATLGKSFGTGPYSDQIQKLIGAGQVGPAMKLFQESVQQQQLDKQRGALRSAFAPVSDTETEMVEPPPEGAMYSEGVNETRDIQRRPTRNEIIGRLSGDPDAGAYIDDLLKEELKEPKPVSVGPGHTLYDTRRGPLYTAPFKPDAPQRTTNMQRAYDEWRAQPGNQGKSYMDFRRELATATHPEGKAARGTPDHPIMDRFLSGNQWVERKTWFDPKSQEWQTKLRPIAPGPVRDTQPRETVETTERITPGKPVTNQKEFNLLNEALPKVVNEVTAQFAKKGLNFNVPGAYVDPGDGRGLVRKEDVLAEAMRRRLKIDAVVVWDGTRFRLVKASTLEQRAPLERKRTTGPAGGQMAAGNVTSYSRPLAGVPEGVQDEGAEAGDEDEAEQE